ncbi:MAG TPA: hypothetical protein DCZ43_03730, partial [candidate division Zixibacteria bacterium]|nr:hypothetical protein [candidate division Zixibacteria bacterium]
AFVSNRNGIDNIYIYEMADGKTYPVTNIISGAFTPTWSPDGDQIAFSAFYKYGFDIFVLKDIQNVSGDNGELKLTHYMQKLRAHETDIFVPAATVASDSTKAIPDTVAAKPTDFSTYVFHTGEGEISDRAGVPKPDTQSVQKPDTSLAAIDTLNYQLPDGSYKQNHYKLKFAPELVTGGLTYDNFYGLQGQSYLSISDLLGNHHFYLLTDLVNTIDQSNIQVAYSYTAKRIDYTASFFHFKNLYFNDANNYYFSDRIYGLQGYITYPFSKFSRLDLTASQITVARENYASGLPANQTTNLLVGSVGYVNDAVIWGLTGPVGGQRYMLKYDQSIKTTGTGLRYGALELDYRKYWYFWGHYNMALRFGSGISGGPDAKTYYLGGTSNWISPRKPMDKTDIYSPEDIYVNELVVPIRGYNYFSEAGNRFSIFNLEFRYPFIDYFKLHFPLPITLGQISGALFWDMGAAWDRHNDRKFLENMRFHAPTESDSTVQNEILAGFGFGPRVNLGIFVLRVDLAWASNLVHVAHKPRWYFSFGAEF